MLFITFFNEFMLELVYIIVLAILVWPNNLLTMGKETLCELKLFRTEPVNLDISAVNTNYEEIFSINRDGYIIDNTYLKNYNDEREIILDSFCLNV